MTYLDVPILNHTPLLPTLQWILLPVCTRNFPIGINQHIQIRQSCRLKTVDMNCRYRLEC